MNFDDVSNIYIASVAIASLSCAPADHYTYPVEKKKEKSNPIYLIIRRSLVVGLTDIVRGTEDLPRFLDGVLNLARHEQGRQGRVFVVVFGAGVPYPELVIVCSCGIERLDRPAKRRM
jgi:hypothetical protein